VTRRKRPPPDGVFLMTIPTTFVIFLPFFVSQVKLNTYCFVGFSFIIYVINIIMACKFTYRSLDNQVEMCIASLLSDCYILDKTNNLTVHVVTINITKNTRSRYSKFVYYNYRHMKSASQKSKTPCY